MAKKRKKKRKGKQGQVGVSSNVIVRGSSKEISFVKGLLYCSISLNLYVTFAAIIMRKGLGYLAVVKQLPLLVPPIIVTLIIVSAICVVQGELHFRFRRPVMHLKMEFAGICLLLLLSILIVGFVVSVYIAALMSAIEIAVVVIVRHRMKRADQGEIVDKTD
ncbi:MAG: hypothetical protein IJ744_05490 [Lachnospiraceae bacterium]|nr:hypothetical protein [Lachnospiraceae bacterium]